MTHKNFDWNPKNWTVDYQAAFDKLKEAVMNSMTLHFPDYDKKWIMRSDASTVACGAVLFQVCENEEGTVKYELIACASNRIFIRKKPSLCIMDSSNLDITYEEKNL
jgi:hypothetical protein